MTDKCTVKCKGCGNEQGLIERPTSDLNLDGKEVGETVTVMCLGDCDSPSTEHEIVSFQN